MGKQSTRSSRPSRRRIRTPTTEKYGGGSGRERESVSNHGEKDTFPRKKAKLLIHELRAFYSHDRFSFLSLQKNHGSLEVSALAAETEGRERQRRSHRAAKLSDPADEANEAEISPRSMLWMRICQNLNRRRRRRRRHGKGGRQLGTEIDAHEDI